MAKFRVRHVARVLGLGAIALYGLVQNAHGGIDDTLAALVQQAVRESPLVAAARHRCAAARANREAQQGYYDPRAMAVAGWSREGRGVPGVSRGDTVTADSAALQAGVEVAMSPGFYLGAGVAERRLTDLGIYEDLFQTEAGVQLSVPLLRDRGFAQWHAAAAAAEAELAATEAGLLRVCEEVGRGVEDRYLLLQQALAAHGIAQAATARASRLLDEALQLLELKMLPAYQVHAARLDVTRRQEEEAAALSVCEIQRRRLTELVGLATVAALPAAAADLSSWTDGLTLPDGGVLEEIAPRRGVYREVRAQWAAARARALAADDEDRSDVTLRAAYTWQGEDEQSLLGGHGTLSDPQAGAEVVVVWKRPLGGRGEAGRRAAARARVDELEAAARQVEREIATACDVAAAEFRSAELRLKLATAAVGDAQAASAAEEERFRLGDGSSRLVLDSQKDLTDAVRRQNDIVTALLRARTAYRYAAGLGSAGASLEHEE